MESIPLGIIENGGKLPLTVADNSTTVGIDVEHVRVIYADLPAYEGDYTVTPNGAEQVLHTRGLRMTGDITVERIPKNYGLVTWNGSFLTIS